MTQGPSRRPLVIEADPEAPAADPASAAPVADASGAVPPQGRAMRRLARAAARRPSWLARLFWGSATALVGLVASVGAWNFVTGLIARNPALGWVAGALVAIVAVTLILIALRELAAFARLARVDAIQGAAGAAMAAADLAAARDVVGRLDRLYARRAELRWARGRLRDDREGMLDADGLLMAAEATLLEPLDQAARREVEAAARQVAAATALVPLALADVLTALVANLRMIRRIAEIYGGRSGLLGSWRLTRSVMTHLVATGAVAVGDDMVHSIAGGTLLSKLSRRFGEGMVNGALTARVGVAAIEVCRPLPFRALPRPSVSALVARALTGLFAETRGAGREATGGAGPNARTKSHPDGGANGDF